MFCKLKQSLVGIMALYIYIYQGRIEGEQFIAVNVLKNIDN